MRRRALCISTIAALLALGAAGVPVAAAAAGPELLSNPSFETTDPDPAINEPAGWNPSSWGTLTPAFEYLTTDGHGGTHSVKVTVTGYTDGDAKWVVDPWPNQDPGVRVTGGEYFIFSDWYRSDTETKVMVWYRLGAADAAGRWATLSSGVPEAADWTQYTTGFTMPAGADRALFVHVIAGNGYLQTDDYSLRTTDAPAGFTRARVSLTFDDGLASVMDNAIPALNAKGFRSTQYIPTGTLESGDPALMSPTQVAALAAAGHEIGSHSVSHLGLLGMTTDQIKSEVAASQAKLQAAIGGGAVVDDFAYPYGDSNAAVITELQAAGYRSGRSIAPGYNGAALAQSVPARFELRVQNMTKNTTLDEFKSWVAFATEHNYWLVIVYHGVTETPGDYETTVSAFQDQLNWLSDVGAEVVTVRQALDVVTNRFPTGTVKIVPAATGTNGVVKAQASFTDADDDPLQLSYEWLIGNTTIPGATTDTLDLSKAGHGDHGDKISVKVTADDGREGITTAQASVTVANTAPTAGTVTIVPAAPRAAAALTARPSAFRDVDGDTLAYTYRWLRNGAVLAGQARAVLPGSLVRAGDTIRVEVRATDGRGGASGVAAASVKVAGSSSSPADTVGPTIVIKSPKHKVYRQGRKLTIRFVCTDTAGIAQWRATLRRRGGGKPRSVAHGTTVRLHRAGRYVLRITATDGKGNVAVKTVRFRVERN